MTGSKHLGEYAAALVVRLCVVKTSASADDLTGMDLTGMAPPTGSLNLAAPAKPAAAKPEASEPPGSAVRLGHFIVQ